MRTGSLSNDGALAVERWPAGLVALGTASLEAALAGGRKTLVIGASRAGCEYALAHPDETILLDHGIPL